MTIKFNPEVLNGNPHGIADDKGEVTSVTLPTIINYTGENGGGIGLVVKRSYTPDGQPLAGQVKFVAPDKSIPINLVFNQFGELDMGAITLTDQQSAIYDASGQLDAIRNSEIDDPRLPTRLPRLVLAFDPITSTNYLDILQTIDGRNLSDLDTFFDETTD